MPKAMEEALKKIALKKFGTTESKAAQAFIYGTMTNYEKRHGMMTEAEKKAKKK